MKGEKYEKSWLDWNYYWKCTNDDCRYCGLESRDVLMDTPSIETITNMGKFALDHSPEFKAGMYIVLAVGASVCIGSIMMIYMPKFK